MTQVPPVDAEPGSARLAMVPATRADVDDILGVLARGMRDNPLHIAAFGTNDTERERLLRQLFRGRFASPEFVSRTVVARGTDGTVIGVYSAMPPGTCTPKPGELIKMIPGTLKLGLGNARRVAEWFGTWGKHDLPTRHWHFGPFAIDADWQGQGIGSVMMRHFCEHMDRLGDDIYLETDKKQNISFYEKFGFRVIDDMHVLGVTNWRMVRKPAGHDL